LPISVVAAGIGKFENVALVYSSDPGCLTAHCWMNLTYCTVRHSLFLAAIFLIVVAASLESQPRSRKWPDDNYDPWPSHFRDTVQYR